ncbi:MAG TPA: YbjN domain-containing protein [Mycobacterium sp.]|nr:YbjN domain-containing protein [Mycobacterium sp.]
MTTRGIGQVMIERYARTRGERLFRADGGEYLILQDSARGHFPVYMRATGSSPDVVKLRARWSAGLARADRSRLLEWVNHFNDRDAWLMASVRDAHDPAALRVVVNSRFYVADEADFGAFARFVDLSLASAAEVFEGVYAEAGAVLASA